MITGGMLKEVICFAAVQKTFLQKAAYLIKGLLFIPFLSRMTGRAASDDRISSTSQAGDDIYPLF